MEIKGILRDKYDFIYPMVAQEVYGVSPIRRKCINHRGPKRKLCCRMQLVRGKGEMGAEVLAE
jgi:hypothetical protein